MELLAPAPPRTLQQPTSPPKPIEIYGEEKNLDSLLEKFAGLWEVAEENRVRYRKLWKAFLPRPRNGAPEPSNAAWCMAYNPLVTVRKSFAFSYTKKVLPDACPYFIIILNAARDERPRQKMAPGRNHAPASDPLQRNILDRRMIIAEFDHFYLTPNGFPYHNYASLLVAKDQKRRQEYPTPKEIEAWMRFSILTEQYVFFNSPHAGASIPGRLHAQVVDPDGIRYENQKVLYPVLNPGIMRRTHIRDGIDVLRGYGIEVLSLKGRDAPHYASLACQKLRDEHNCWYNFMVNGEEVMVVGRNAEKETSHCIGKKCGAYEMSGVILVGNIEEPLLQKTSGERVVNGALIFSQLQYEQIASNIANAAVGLGGLEHKL